MTAVVLLTALSVAATDAGAASPDELARPASDPPVSVEGVTHAPADGPDVELHVPRAEVQKLALEVENLQARLDLDTSVASLVHISAGVVATVQKLKLQLEGVQAETHLVVRLQRVTDVMARALGAIEKQPDLAGNASASARALAPVPAVSVDAASGPSERPSMPGQE